MNSPLRSPLPSPDRGRGDKRGRSEDRSPTPDLRSMMKAFRTSPRDVTRELGEKIDGLETRLTQHVDAKAAETLTAAKAYTDEQLTQAMANTQIGEPPLLKLRAATERSLRNSTANIVLLSNFTPNDNEATRKAAIDEVKTAIGKTYRKVEHVKQGGALTQFSRVEFEAAGTAQAFISKWIAMKKQNASGRPVFARTDMAKELRALRAPLVTAEKDLKAYFQAQDEKHKVKTGNWAQGGELLVDQRAVARLTGHLTVEWSDKALEAAVASLMR